MNKRGTVLTITLTFALVFTLFGFGTIYMAMVHNEAAEKRIASEKAFWLAEAGIQKALWEFKYNNCSGLFSETTGMPCSSCSGCGVKVLAATVGTDGDYDLEMNGVNSAVTATGSFPNRTPGPDRAQRSVQLTSQSQFNYALFAKDNISLYNGTTVDSYNSDLGPYGPGNSNSNGDVGSNGTSHGVISLLNNITINGDVSTGPGGTIGFPPPTNGNFIEGDVTHDNDVDLPPVVVPASLSGLSSLGDLIVPNAGTATLSAGDYKYNRIAMNHNGKLLINGDVSIYLTETGFNALNVWDSSEVVVNPGGSLKIYTDGHISVHTGSKLNNLTQDPNNLIINSTVSSSIQGANIWIGGEFYGAIYAPNAHISLTNSGDIFGAFVAKNFNIPNTVNIHYDEGLGESIGSAGTIWQEINDHLVP